jgi:hypothetical protein
MTLYGVSDIVPSHPAWHAEGLRWLEAFDRIDLGDIREQARRNRAAVPQRHGIASALHRELSAIFDPTNEVQFTSNRGVFRADRQRPDLRDLGNRDISRASHPEVP